ncbi:hypothetical protein SORBI_3007G141420 [Sorghum bicolor]|uniref:Uncharacterized protein n=1 Tax=Sorghum bicolor TaxID=4558 RepID=A0A1Z5R9Z5_SORBI|nr:hypothetical protein SORBI_3007G141420 [Sorghum bicolor]
MGTKLIVNCSNTSWTSSLIGYRTSPRPHATPTSSLGYMRPPRKPPGCSLRARPARAQPLTYHASNCWSPYMVAVRRSTVARRHPCRPLPSCLLGFLPDLVRASNSPPSELPPHRICLTQGEGTEMKLVLCMRKKQY